MAGGARHAARLQFRPTSVRMLLGRVGDGVTALREVFSRPRNGMAGCQRRRCGKYQERDESFHGNPPLRAESPDVLGNGSGAIVVPIPGLLMPHAFLRLVIRHKMTYITVINNSEE